jgi:hypothetical protein
MTDPITPSEQELKAAAIIKSGQYWHDLENLATIIATHTRHEGKTAQEWAELYKVMVEKSESVLLWKHRAEIAESQVKEWEITAQNLLTRAEIAETTVRYCQTTLIKQAGCDDAAPIEHNVRCVTKRIAELEAGK